MKRFSFFLALAFVVVSFGLANSTVISVDAVENSWDDGGTLKIVPMTSNKIDIRYNYEGADTLGGFSGGFKIYGPSTFTPIGYELVDQNFKKAGYWATFFKAIPFNSDGLGADTFVFSGAADADPFIDPLGHGLPNGYNQVPFKIISGMVAEGETLCIDTTFAPNSYFWKWHAPEENESVWHAEPQCFLAQTPPCQAPDLTNPTAQLVGTNCANITYDFDAALNPNDDQGNPIIFSAALGSIDAVTGAYTYTPTAADVGASISETISVSNGTCANDFAVDIVVNNNAPTIDCPTVTFKVSTGTPFEITLTASDDVCDNLSWSVLSGDGSFADPNVGVLTILTAVEGLGQSVVVQVSDGNNANATATCEILFDAVPGSIYQVELACVGDQDENFVYQGQFVDVPVELVTHNSIGGYDMLISYDNSALSFQSAEMGAGYVACNWEYFTYRYGASGNCNGGCPSGMVRVIGIAETNNGPNHPICFDAEGPLFTLSFLVTNDRTVQCSSIPIRFFWLDCGDNTLSSIDGNELHISEAVYDGYDEINMTEQAIDIFDPTYGFPTYFGAQEECDYSNGDKQTFRDVSFKNGCVFVACADSIDLRADVNLNNIPYEIADAVLYSRYFVYGLGVFTINTEGQIAASDVNADGLSLSVADLVYLIRVVIGDALPYAKPAPVYAEVVDTDNILSVKEEMGAALIVINGNVTPELLVNNMDITFNYDANTNSTRALIYSLEGNTFSGDFISANGSVVSLELGSASGAVVNAKVLPGNFELAQNYPNPFNPSTSVSFSIPYATDANLAIYNITGQKVAEFSGNYEAGVHIIEWDASNMASGVYFYKLNAGDFEATKKMVLMK